MSNRPPTAWFTVRGSRPATIEVGGVFDAAATTGFWAVVVWLIGEKQVTIDLTRCDAVDEAAHRAVDQAVERIGRAGGSARVLEPAAARVAVGV